MAAPLSVGVTYLPAPTGIHLWQEWRSARVEHDLARIRAQGFGSIRLHLAWDAFMPSHRQVDGHRVRDLGGLLDCARALGLVVVVVLFAQSHGDCVLLPAYAVDRRRARSGVRVIVEGSVRDGGPRDLYADPLMLEICERWLHALLDAFANHPAVAAWDLGHDPATTVRPRRIAALASWVELCASWVRGRGDRVRLTLGAGDVLTARGVRLAAVAPHVDELGLVVRSQALPAIGGAGGADAAAAAFTVHLAQRLASPEAGAAPPLHVVTGVAVDAAPAPPPWRRGGGEEPRTWDLRPLAPPEAARHTGELLDRLGAAGAAGVCAAAWSALERRPLEAPPCDRRPTLGREGVGGPDGALGEHGEVWSGLARADAAAQEPAPWPVRLDVEEYYANLPDSALDLLAGWRSEFAAPAL